MCINEILLKHKAINFKFSSIFRKKNNKFEEKSLQFVIYVHISSIFDYIEHTEFIL